MAEPSVRLLRPPDLADVMELLAVDPVADCFVGSRALDSGLRPGLLGGELWGWGPPGGLSAVCYSGANLVPAGVLDEVAAIAFAGHAARRARRCSSIVGREPAVRLLWERLGAVWGPAREERWDQPVMTIRRPGTVPPDPQVRLTRPEELEALLPAAVAMFTEEVGVSPLAAGGGPAYRARFAELVRQGRSLVRLDGGRVVFKAELAAVSPWSCQIQGVWVDPEFRGRGIGTAAMSAVVAHALTVVPTVSLYVNAHNTAARRCYQRVGFGDEGRFATILW